MGLPKSTQPAPRAGTGLTPAGPGFGLSWVTWSFSLPPLCPSCSLVTDFQDHRPASLAALPPRPRQALEILSSNRNSLPLYA